MHIYYYYFLLFSKAKFFIDIFYFLSSINIFTFLDSYQRLSLSCNGTSFLFLLFYYYLFFAILFVCGDDSAKLKFNLSHPSQKFFESLSVLILFTMSKKGFLYFIDSFVPVIFCLTLSIFCASSQIT